MTTVGPKQALKTGHPKHDGHYRTLPPRRQPHLHPAPRTKDDIQKMAAAVSAIKEGTTHPLPRRHPHAPSSPAATRRACKPSPPRVRPTDRHRTRQLRSHHHRAPRATSGEAMATSSAGARRKAPSPPKHRHDGTSPLPLGMDWSPPPKRWLLNYPKTLWLSRLLLLKRNDPVQTILCLRKVAR
ncbi:hypothetical protein SORBI_3003G368901 [Sorghum bicolor]|uniref:Uncharacterized protein n=1 Tax=Sorghum bicolor TaxID=4558 RepID=A0A1W0W0N9_SORBI|nr:hypothetical protein SORBI_3003G368901 [Sorghum bicolor]